MSAAEYMTEVMGRTYTAHARHQFCGADEAFTRPRSHDR